jgi:hypothetical protein
MAQTYWLVVDGFPVARGGLGECWGAALIKDLVVTSTDAVTLHPRALIAPAEAESEADPQQLRSRRHRGPYR